MSLRHEIWVRVVDTYYKVGEDFDLPQARIVRDELEAYDLLVEVRGVYK